MRTPNLPCAAISSVAVLICTAAAAHAVVTHDEGVNGDISGLGSTPTQHSLFIGSNTVIGSVIAGDRDYLALIVPAGASLSSVVLENHASNSAVSFIGVQSGATFTEPPTGTNVANLLGWTHFGQVQGQVGTDILDDMAVGAGAMGFSPPLPAGTYTFWIQETSSNLSSYTFNFIVVPAPSSLAVALLLTGPAFRRRR